jgi:hypothetical protein
MTPEDLESIEKRKEEAWNALVAASRKPGRGRAIVLASSWLSDMDTLIAEVKAQAREIEQLRKSLAAAKASILPTPFVN